MRKNQIVKIFYKYNGKTTGVQVIKPTKNFKGNVKDLVNHIAGNKEHTFKVQ